MTNKEKFLNLVSESDTQTLKSVKTRIKNREMLRESQRIAMKVLFRLHELNWSKKRLADEMNVAPQQITKILSGKENITLDTVTKLQNILNIALLASFKKDDNNSQNLVSQKVCSEQILDAFSNNNNNKYNYTLLIELKYNNNLNNQLCYIN